MPFFISCHDSSPPSKPDDKNAETENPQTKSDSTPFDRAVAAIEKRDIATAAKQAKLIAGDGKRATRQRELITIGTLIAQSKSTDAIDRLNALEPMPSNGKVEGIRLTYLFRALLMNNKIDQAHEAIKQANAADPDSPLIDSQLVYIQELIAKRENDTTFIARLRPKINAFCGDCHATPKPEHFAVDRWPLEVDRGIELATLMMRRDLTPPDRDEMVRWFQMQAPKEVDLRAFVRRNIPPLESTKLIPVEPSATGRSDIATSSIEVSEQNGRPMLIVSDMRNGRVTLCDPLKPSREPMLLAELENPGPVEPCDLNNDGLTDYLVADLGSLTPADHSDGRVVYLQAKTSGTKSSDENSASQTFEQTILLENVGRVSHVQRGDFDGDGDIDLLVAVYGNIHSGGIYLLNNNSKNDESISFTSSLILKRDGAIHVPPIDLNGDGHLDFVALMAQEQESILAFINDGKANFRSHVLHSVDNPAFGSSGISLTDIDGDGDIDILYTNGDTYDSMLVKPYHGIQWLENKGDLEFEYHRILAVIGAYDAVAADIDNDGDQDIVAVAALPVVKLDRQFIDRSESVICFLNDGKQNFVPRILERGVPLRFCVVAEDFDGDGDTDIAAARFKVHPEPTPMPPFDVWNNQLREDEK